MLRAMNICLILPLLSVHRHAIGTVYLCGAILLGSIVESVLLLELDLGEARVAVAVAATPPASPPSSIGMTLSVTMACC